MKRMLILSILLCSLVFTACDSSSIGVIGGADGPTAIYVGEKAPEDKWGLTLRAEAITEKGLTLTFVQSGGNPTGELQTGAAFWLEQKTGETWQPVDGMTEPIWNSLAYLIKKDDVTELSVNWEFLYGTLSPGTYRIGKEVMDFREAGSYDTAMYFAEFTIL